MADMPGDRELWGMTLRDLSKTLPSNHSYRSTLATYLRWLEIHRQEETRCTNNWPNTILHWTQALKNRGFSEDELISKVNMWKEDNGPFRSSASRYPPDTRDIKRGFTAKESGKTGKEGTSGHNTDFDGPPPKNYICNRCGKGGHHLQVCPTNMDPAYDKSPGQGYICAVCHVEGEHYKSLCPKNFDPYSIAQRRKVAGISSKGLSEQRKNEPEPRRLQSDSETPSPTFIKRNRDIDSLKQRYERGESVDSDDMEIAGVSFEKDGHQKCSIEDGPMSKQYRTGDFWSGNFTIRERRVLGPDVDIIAGEKTAEVRCPMDVTATSPMLKYSAFVRSLSASSRAYMSEIVNPVKPRPTVAYIWEQEEIDRFLDSVMDGHELNQEPYNSNLASPNSSEACSPVQNMCGRLTPYGESESD